MTAIEQAKQDIVQKYGPWTATNVDLGGGVFTIGEHAPRIQPNIMRFGQIISDITATPISQLRILDLACLEGEYAIELARQGARVVGIEGRLANVEKARLAKQALNLRNLDLIHDDVRNLNIEKFGSFDVVICSGILYHLDAADQLPFIERLQEVCKRCLIVDTHVGGRAQHSVAHKGATYGGTIFIEHHKVSSREERERSLWASLDNQTSFWLTRPSLYNALTSVGFTSVYECHSPAFVRSPDRITLVAIKGQAYVPRAAPSPAQARWPEFSQSNTRYYLRNLARGIAMRLPYRVTRLLRSLAGKR